MPRPFPTFDVFRCNEDDFSIGFGDDRIYAGHSAARVILEINSPFPGKGIDVEGARLAFMTDEFGYVESDTARTHDRDLLPDSLVAFDDVDISNDLGMVDAFDVPGDAARYPSR